jgi:hypothetical protein
MWNSLPLLPLTCEELEAGMLAAIAALQRSRLNEEEAVLKLKASFQGWLDTDSVIAPIPEEVRPILAAAAWAKILPEPAHRSYLALIRKIVGKYVGTKREAVILLSQLPLMLLLARDFSASPARIAQLLGSADGRNPVSWRAVQTLLVHFRIRNELDAVLVSELIGEDEILSTVDFGDADVETVVNLLAEQAACFGLGAGFRDSLAALLTPLQGDPFIPYLQILLYISVVDHFYDHPPEFIYTFKPRGAVANLVFSKFPDQLAPGGNPMLNNFKAVDRLTYDWAESREDNRIQAVALVSVIMGISSLSFPAKKQLSQIIRRGIFRFIEVRTPAEIIIPTVRELDEVSTFLLQVAARPTETRGIIEQRVTDFLSAMSHKDVAWRPRGLGDPVNASNTASRKLGDCDFQNAIHHQCHAYEAHAGRLTDVYLEEHLRTLRLNLPKRINEWSGISEISEWRMKVTFLVHEDARSNPTDSLSTQIPCELQVMTFADATSAVLKAVEEDQQTCLRLFNKMVIEPLNTPNTPHGTKRKARQFLVEGV